MYIVPDNIDGMFLWHGDVLKGYQNYVFELLGIHVKFMFRSKMEFEMFDMGTDVPLYMEIEYSNKLSRAQLHCIGAELVMSSMRVSSYSLKGTRIVFRRTDVWKKARFDANLHKPGFLEDYWGTSFARLTQLKGLFWRVVHRYSSV